MSLLRTFVLRDPGHYRNLLGFIGANWEACAKRERPLEIVVSEYKAKRSDAQNKRYWAILNEIAESAWVDGKQFSSDAWHERFKRVLIGSEELPGGGEVGISTTTLDVAEFSTYMDKIESYAVSELGVEFAA